MVAIQTNDWPDITMPFVFLTLSLVRLAVSGWRRVLISISNSAERSAVSAVALML